MSTAKYVLITPCRDEAQYARQCLDSVLAQVVQPDLWVIVDDGSSDETPEILAEYAEKVDWIKIIRREDRGRRAVGPGVIDAFYAGLDTVDLSSYDFLCKFDLDLDIPATYFSTLLSWMSEEPALGTCSGKPYFKSDDGKRLISEKIGDEMSVGMTKFYRRECFEQIGGFVREVMWDGIDCHTCRMMGWIAYSRDDPQTRFIHLRPMGSSQQSIWTGRMRHGYGQYYMGTGPLYMTASAAYRMTRPPLVVGGIGMWWGYIKSLVKRLPRYDNTKFREFLRRYQWACLWKGKATATEELHRFARNTRG